MDTPVQPSTKASEILDRLDINKIIQLIVDVSNGEKKPEEAVHEYAKPYIDMAGVFVVNKTKEWINNGVERAGMKELSETEFADSLINSAKGVAQAVHRYLWEGMTDEQFVKALGNVGIQDIATQILSALGITDSLGVENVGEILKLAPPVLALNASMAAYKELRKAMDDLEAARERRKEIEAACEESIAMIREYRAEMERIVAEYLTVRLETFEHAFATMEKALVEMDSDGYLAGNAEIQKILNYDVQFTNQKEFDDLMISDEKFKL